MNDKQIREMMRDIDPQFQQKADERAAAVRPAARRRIAMPVLIGSLAAGCAAVAAAVYLPKLHTDRAEIPATTLESELEQEIEEIPAEAVMPITDFSEDTIRLMAPAYAPYALDISAAQQQALAEALLASVWTPCAQDAPLPDGEAYSIFVYNGGDPYRLTEYGDGSVILERNGAETRWMLSGDADRAIAEAANPDSVEGHLTWCAEDSVNASDIWKNIRVGAKECDMTDKRDIFYKMNNTVDYFDRCSGYVKHGFGGEMTAYEFQVDLNTAQAYQHEENYYGPSAEVLMNGGDGIRDAHFSATYTQDGTDCYWVSDLMSEKCTKFPGVKHRIDSPTVAFEDLHSTDPDNQEYDYWNSRRQLLDGISVDCIENYRMAVDWLQDFDKWEIVGTETVNGRECVHLQGETDSNYDNIRRFEFYVDQATGVTVRFLSYDENGNVGRFIDVTELAFDGDAAPVKTLDPEIIASAVRADFVCQADGGSSEMPPEGVEVPVQEPAADAPEEAEVPAEKPVREPAAEQAAP